MKTTISFVRHGQVHNPRNVYYGRLPYFRLSDAGRRDADSASHLLLEDGCAAVFSSPLLRARQTAMIILTRHPHLALRKSKLLLEIHSPYDGRPASELIARNWDVYTGSPPNTSSHRMYWTEPKNL